MKAITQETEIQHSYVNRHACCDLHDESDVVESDIDRAVTVDEISVNEFATPVGEKLQFDFLWTCKQIYREAALLVFEKNVFAFHTMPAMSEFLCNLKKNQRKAIKSVTLSGDISTIPISTVTSLTGLRNLLSFFELDESYEDANVFLDLDPRPGVRSRPRSLD